MLCTALDVIVMKRHNSVIGSHTGLRMMIFGAGVLAVLLLAYAGTAWGVRLDAEMISGWCNEGDHHE